MKKNQAYKIRKSDAKRQYDDYEYYYADDFLWDIETGKMYISMYGIDIETLDTAQITSKFIVEADKFNDYFYDDDSVLDSDWLYEKAVSLESEDK
jgi:hypothetical protein